MKIRLLLLFIIVLTPAMLPAQEETAEELFDDALFFFEREDYEEAAYLFRQVLNAEPGHDNVRFMLGRSYLNIPGQEQLAIPYLLKATENIDPSVSTFKRSRYRDRKAPHHTWFFLGNAYRINNQLEEALEAYEQFKSIKNFEKKYNARITEEEIKSVERAQIIRDAPLDLYTSVFDEPINTTGKDYNAIISADERVLVWMNSQKFYEAIMMSVKVDGKWTDPVNITPQVGSDGDMIPTGLSPDGKELLLVRQGQFDSDIYISTHDGTFWSKAVPIPGDINSNFTEAHASFYPSGDSILVASDRRETRGGLDIFVSGRRSDNTWSEPEPLSGSVNTEQDETSAYISPDGSRLLFASKGHFNMGDYDIFYSDIDEEGRFGSSVNIGFPVNTTNSNTYWCPVKDGFSAIYHKRSDEGIGQEDIWFIEIIPYEETVARSLTRLSEQDFSIRITDRETGEVIELRYDAIEDKISISSKKGKDYNIVYSRDEY